MIVARPLTAPAAARDLAGINDRPPVNRPRTSIVIEFIFMLTHQLPGGPTAAGQIEAVLKAAGSAGVRP